MAKPRTEDASEDAKKIVDDAKNFIEKAIADIGKTSASKQLILGTASGWITGFMSMKIGKIAAVGLGGGVILLHIASQKGYIDINWDKINKKVDKITDKIEKEATGRSPDWFEKFLPSKDSGYALNYLEKIAKQQYSLLASVHERPRPDSYKHPFILLQVERFVDRKLDKAEDLIKKKEKKAKHWYNNFTGDDEYRATETHVFLASFVAGMAVGLLCGK